MKQLLTLFLLLPMVLFSQSWDLDLGGYYFFDKVELEERVSEFSFDVALPNTMDTVLRQTIRSSSASGSIFVSRPSLSIGVGRTTEVSDRFSYRLGGGMMLRSMNLRDTFDFFGSEVLSEELVAVDNNPPLSTFGSTCDRFTNDFNDIGPLDRTELINVYYLRLGAEASYVVSQDLFSLIGGIELRTPLFSLRQNERVLLNREEIEDETVCTYAFDLFQDRSGNAFRNANFSINIGGIFTIDESIKVQIGLSQELQGMFAYPPTSFQQNQDVLTPREVFVKIRYAFGEGHRQPHLPADSK